jgi:hypothetical protein
VIAAYLKLRPARGELALIRTNCFAGVSAQPGAWIGSTNQLQIETNVGKMPFAADPGEIDS